MAWTGSPSSSCLLTNLGVPGAQQGHVQHPAIRKTTSMLLLFLRILRFPPFPRVPLRVRPPTRPSNSMGFEIHTSATCVGERPNQNPQDLYFYLRLLPPSSYIVGIGPPGALSQLLMQHDILLTQKSHALFGAITIASITVTSPGRREGPWYSAHGCPLQLCCASS